MRAGLTVLQLSGLIYTCLDAKVIVTAEAETLSAWTSEDGVYWDEVAIRAGGRNLFEGLLDLRESAKAWCQELQRTGRV